MGSYLRLGVIAALLATTTPAAAEDATGNATPPPAGQAEANVDSGKVVVSSRPVEVLAGPSSASSVLYGFPAGRPFRLISREAGFAHIQDLKSSATGWVDNTALAEAPAEGTSASYAPRQNPAAKESSQQNAAQQPSYSQPSTARRGPLDGILGGLFGGH
jgi:hypothetical protein